MSIKYSLVIQVDSALNQIPDHYLTAKSNDKSQQRKTFLSGGHAYCSKLLIWPKQFYFIHEMVTFFFQMLKFFSAVNSWPITVRGFRRLIRRDEECCLWLPVVCGLYSEQVPAVRLLHTIKLISCFYESFLNSSLSKGRMISVRTVQNRKFKIHLNGLKLIINEKMS